VSSRLATRSSKPPEALDSAYLRALGDNIRAQRARHGITRKALAERSGVSERFLAQLEGGTGNASVLILRRIAAALSVELEVLLAEPRHSARSEELRQTVDFLRGLDEDALTRARDLLRDHFGKTSHPPDEDARRQRIALIGLRGAGKSTLGARLAKEMNVPFIELDRLVEKAAGTPLSMIFDLYGQSGFRRFESRCLDEVLAKHARFVLATGGSIVSEPATFDRLLRECYTVWLRATPEEHMQRVIAQGDMRPMADNPEAMSELKQILAEREPLYRQADLTLDTSARPLDESLATLAASLLAESVAP
jgi:XRE family transcriptional regulator, aerobic/anaerobic benzoate catabolism transcriptional regulator